MCLSVPVRGSVRKVQATILGLSNTALAAAFIDMATFLL